MEHNDSLTTAGPDIQQNAEPPRKSKHALGLTYILMGFLLLAIIATTQGLMNPLSFFSQAASDTATISIQPASSTLPPNKTYQMWITSEASVGFIRVSLSFDPNALQLTGEPVIILPKFNTITLTSMVQANATGKIMLVAGLDATQVASAPSGTYQFATIPLSAKATQSQMTTQMTVVLADSQIANMNARALSLNANNTSITLNSGTTTIAALPTIIAIANTPTKTPTPMPTQGSFGSLAPTTQPPVAQQHPIITTNLLESAIVNRTHTFQVSATDHTVGDTLTMTATGLPPGIRLESCNAQHKTEGTAITCRITGKPTHTGVFYPTFTTTDASGGISSKTMTHEVTTWRKHFQTLLGNFSDFRFRNH